MLAARAAGRPARLATPAIATLINEEFGAREAHLSAQPAQA
jgi:hypothetical protein